MRLIAHVDMDAFFAAIEARDTPAFRGVPLVVGADPQAGKGRGVVATSNYPAREYGIHSATPISTAWKLSEAARLRGQLPVTFVSVEMSKYRAVSDRVMDIIRRFMPRLEQASIDEAYGDVSDTCSYEAAETHCRAMKRAIWEEEHLTASVGIGPNRMIAKIASGMHKPDGMTIVREPDVDAFLTPLSVRAIPGVGPKTAAELGKRGIVYIRDLRRCSIQELDHLFGTRGAQLYARSRGLDDSPVEEHWQAKSIGEQETFDEDTCGSDRLCTALAVLCRGVMERLHREGFVSFRTVVLIVRFADFETKSRSRTLADPSGEEVTLRRETLKLLLPFLDRRDNPGHKLIRLLGVRVEKLVTVDQRPRRRLRPEGPSLFP